MFEFLVGVGVGCHILAICALLFDFGFLLFMIPFAIGSLSLLGAYILNNWYIDGLY